MSEILRRRFGKGMAEPLPDLLMVTAERAVGHGPGGDAGSADRRPLGRHRIAKKDEQGEAHDKIFLPGRSNWSISAGRATSCSFSSARETKRTVMPSRFIAAADGQRLYPQRWTRSRDRPGPQRPPDRSFRQLSYPGSHARRTERAARFHRKLAETIKENLE
jgi:hypothetical protein